MAVSSDKIKFAGDVNIDDVTIINNRGLYQNVTAQVIQISYFEDMFADFLTGSVVVKDSHDLMNLFQFTGEEYIRLKFSTPQLEKPIKNTFYITSITDRTITGDREVHYVINFISPEAIVDVNKKVSRAYKGKVSEVVKKFIYETETGLESKKSYNIEETSNNITYTSNFWSPTDNLSYLAEKAENTKGVPSYLFFENNNGFNFVSLDSLNGQPIKQAFVMDKYTREDLGNGRTAMNIEEDFTRIIDLQIPKSFDYMENATGGMYASRLHTYDAILKTYTAKNYNFRDAFARRTTLNPNQVQSAKGIFRNAAAMDFMNRMTSNFSGGGDESGFKTFQERTSILKMSNANKLEITVPGRTDYCAGMKVGVTLNKMQPITPREDQSDITDRMYSGYYLVSAINHTVTKEKHECHMELIKDSMQADLNKTGSR